MNTVLTTLVDEAADFIRRGLLVAFPTETVYGLGGDIFDEDAIRRIYEAKRRPADNPLIAHIGSIDYIEQLAADVPTDAERLIAAFFPGPLTIVLPKTRSVPHIATAGLDTIGIRMPRHPLANRFLMACDHPVGAPSANVSGRPSPTTWQAVAEDLDGRIDCILQGGDTEIGLESTVVDCTGEVPILLRTGAVSLEQLRAIVPDIGSLTDGQAVDAPRSPGLRHKHYSPRATVLIAAKFEFLDLAEDDAYIGLHIPPGVNGFRYIAPSIEAYAHSMFEFFRECDRRGMRRILCEPVPAEGIGSALMDRIERAARS